MGPKNIPMNPNSLKARFTRRFLQSLMKIKRETPTSSSSRREMLHRYHRVKVAADTSMARAASSRRFWSRAMFWRMRNQNRRKRFVKRIKIDAFLGIFPHGNKKNLAKNNKKKSYNEEKAICPREVDELRKIVPGGEFLDLCSLLNETADYIKCLCTQVEVMKDIVDLHST